MEIIKYLNACVTDHPYDTLAELKDHLGIKHSHDERFPELYVLNYCQIDSPKHHPITIECRSLVVEFVKMGEWKVVSRSFDRFFNYGETDSGYNASQLVAHEKMDGSLIGLFYHAKYGWLYRTRSVIMPTGMVNAMNVTWAELIEEALGKKWFDAVELHKYTIEDPDRHVTFILEVTSPDNRIVTRYEDRKMTLLAVRVNRTGAYISVGPKSQQNILDLGWKFPQTWTFESMTDCANGAKDLRELNEGYVMYNRLGEPVCKVKNPAYVAAHHLRGQGILTPKRVIHLLELNEMAEYLSIFPEDASKMEPYVRAYFAVFAECEVLWSLYGTVAKGKPFALKVNKSPVAGIMFRKKTADVDFKDAFHAMPDKNKVGLIEKFLK